MKRKGIIMSRRDWASPKAVHQHILNYFRDHKTATENVLNTRHDPNVVSNVLHLLVERNVLELRIDDSKVGSNRRIYSLSEGVKLK